MAKSGAELTGFLDRNEISNFSIWNAGEDLIFGYYENRDNRCKGEGEKAEITVLTEKIQGYVRLDFHSGSGYAADVS